MIKRIFLSIITLCITSASATDDRARDSILMSIESAIRIDYRACTGDSSRVDISRLIGWKKRQDLTVQSRAYREAVPRFLRQRGDSTTSFLPCQVTAFIVVENKKQLAAEKIIIDKLLAREDAETMRKDLAANPPSAFDFHSIPFGISQETLVRLFGTAFAGRSLVNTGRYLYADSIFVQNQLLVVAFYFGRSGRFYKYAIESSLQPAAALDSVVRPAAEAIGELLTATCGEPTYRANVGFFDIKAGMVSCQRQWDKDSCFAFSGMALFNNRCYAKALVVNRRIEALEQSLRRGSLAPRYADEPIMR